MAQGKSDGTVYIDTRIDTSGIDQGLSTTKSKINTVVGSLNKLGNSIKKAFSGMGMTKRVDTGAANYEAQIKKLELQLDRLIEKQIRFVQTGGNTKSRAFAGMEYDIAQVSAKLEELRAKKASLDSLSASESRAVENASMLKNMVNLIRSSFANLIPNLKSAKKTLLSFAGKGIINGIKKIGSQVKKLASSLLSVGKGAKKSNRSLLMMVGSSVLFSAVFRALSALINSFKEGVQNLAQYSDEANSSMSSLKIATGQLKNSLATAFMPLITMVTPALVSFINTINKALTAIGAFFSALSGKNTFIKAVAVQEDYASSLDKTASSAKKAEKAQKSYTSILDELNVVSESETDSGVASGVSPGQMFEESEIDDGIMAFANKIKEIFNTLKDFIQNEDWDGLGAYLASGVNKVFQYLYDVLNWKNVEKKVMPFIIAFTETFNSFVDNIDWELIGKTIGTGFNTLVNILYELITRIDWKNLGVKFGEGINGLFDEIDWTKAGATLGEAFKGLLDLIIGFLEQTDWKKIGTSVAQFIGGIDWNGITSRLFEGIGAALGGFAAFVWGLIEDAWKSVVDWWHEVAFEDGKFTIKGLLNGILEALKDIGTWIVDNIFKPFIEGFKAAFGIHSPSTVMAEMGVFIIRGLLDGILSLFPDLEDSLKNIKKIFTEKLSDIKSIWDEKWDSFYEKVSGIWGKISDTVSNAIDKMKGWISDLIDKFNDAKSKLSSLSSKAKTSSVLYSGVGSSIGNVISGIGNINIPKLASGTVIPPNSPYMAILGDQKHGTNIEAPLDTIKQAVREVVGNGNGGVLHAHLYLDGKEVLTSIIDMAKLEQTSTGVNPLLLT